MNKLFFIALFVIFLVSCEKRYEPGTLNNFSIEFEHRDYKVGEPIRFLINGKPENLVFWSGESGRKYEFRKRTVVEGNTVWLNFKSFAANGPVDKSTLTLLVSTDFNGKYDSANVSGATWEDITAKAVLSSGQDQTESGNIDLSAFASRNKDMAIALRYKTAVVKPVTAQNRWIIRSFDLNCISQEGENTVLANIANAGWTPFSFSGPATTWSISTTQLLCVRNETELDDDWVVTKQFNPNKVMPDKGEVVKNISENTSEYIRAYDRPGKYNIAFVATNINVKNELSIVKEIELNIIP